MRETETEKMGFGERIETGSFCNRKPSENKTRSCNWKHGMEEMMTSIILDLA